MSERQSNNQGDPRQAGGPAAFTPETGGPDHSRGGHQAGTPGPGPGSAERGDRDLTPDEQREQGRAAPERR